jgi:hypothetical protein
VPIDRQDIIDLKVGTEVRHMLAMEGWAHLERILQQRIKEMEGAVLRPYSVARASEAALSREDYQEIVAEKKGALMGLKLALDIPRAIVASADDIMARIPQDEQDAALRDS